MAEMMGVMSDVIEKIREQHHHVPRLLCGVQTAFPTVVTHQFSNRSSAKVLSCSEDFPHEGLHKDSVCCWNFHAFGAQTHALSDRGPRDVGHCSCGRSDCPTEKAVRP